MRADLIQLRVVSSENAQPNKRGTDDAAIPGQLRVGWQWRGASDPGRSATFLLAL